MVRVSIANEPGTQAAEIGLCPRAGSISQKTVQRRRPHQRARSTSAGMVERLRRTSRVLGVTHSLALGVRYRLACARDSLSARLWLSLVVG